MQRGLARRHTRRDLRGATKQEFGHAGMTARGLTVFQGLRATPCDGPRQSQFTRDYCPRKISFADEVRDDVDLIAIYHVLSKREPYREALGTTAQRDAEAAAKRLIRQGEQLGFQVTLTPKLAA